MIGGCRFTRNIYTENSKEHFYIYIFTYIRKCSTKSESGFALRSKSLASLNYRYLDVFLSLYMPFKDTGFVLDAGSQ